MPSDESISADNPALMVSVIILTKDEESDLPRCLRSLHWCDDIHIVDSGSTDRTAHLAKELGAQVYFNPFAGFGAQRNWALTSCNLKYNWILFLDADEESTSEFAQAVAHSINTASLATAGYYCCWKLMLNGHWLRRSDSFPKWQLRLLYKGRITFIDSGHGQKEGTVSGKIEYIRTPYLHHAFSKGWQHWIERHNGYSDKEAVARSLSQPNWRGVLSSDGSLRNAALKTIVSRIPGWPLIRFLQAYILSGGFLDGIDGLNYTLLLSYYEFTIRLKMNELRQAPRVKR